MGRQLKLEVLVVYLVVSCDPVFVDGDILGVQQLTARTVLPYNAKKEWVSMVQYGQRERRKLVVHAEKINWPFLKVISSIKRQADGETTERVTDRERATKREGEKK